ncbi:MAG: hypothetical protein A2Z77_04690 [Chloroflexi bacterium RBG_13_51_36]|nr:MAG: hypothetical protein A2Z77_04690 [Chloroflexi bacterium RBG_13_51_36]
MKTKAKIAVATVVLLGILWPFKVALASDLFYGGDIVTDSIDIRVEADEHATVNATFLLTNRGTEDQEIDLQFAQSPVPLEADGEELSSPVLFRPGESKSINLTLNLDITGETTKMLFLDPAMLFDGKPNSETTKVLMIRVVLPQGVNGLAWASQEPDEESFEDGRKSYSWSNADIYPTTLCLKWSTLQVELIVEKSATPQEITSRDQRIDLEITLQNKGNTTVDRIALTDLYMAFDFEAVYPLWEFSEEATWLFWMKNINSLEPGETETFAYRVRYIGVSSQSSEFDLEPCVVTVDGHLVTMSNKVRMSKTGDALPNPTDSEAPPESEAGPLHFPSLPLLGGILLILAIARGGYLIWKRRHTG